MNKAKLLKMFFIAASVLCLVAALVACGEGGNGGDSATLSPEADYKVTVKDALGKPYGTGIIVQYMKDGQQVAMQVVDSNGVAVKTLDRGDYTVELKYTTDDAFYYDKDALVFSAEKTELDVMLSHTVGESDAETVYAEPVSGGTDNEHTAYRVNEGCTYIELDESDRTYVLFTPDRAGTYEFGVAGDTASIGYYGMPHFIQKQSAAEVKDNKVSISVSSGMVGGNTFVIGLDASSESVKGSVVTIERTGDPEYSIEDEPWTEYKALSAPSAYTLPAGSVLKEFDITADSDEYELVFNENDGFYHLGSADGELVLVRLAEKNKYIESFKKILESSGVVKYFFDEDGNFLKKENYGNCLLEYIACVDEESGTYPLTKDLMYIIQQRGDYSGWWDKEGANFIFKDENGSIIPGINTEIAWLFMCCYIQG